MTKLLPRARQNAIATVLILAALAGGAPETRGEEKVLKVVPHAPLGQLDPIASPVHITRIYGLQVYETLFAWDEKWQPQPLMVRDHRMSADGLTYDLMLRSDLKFHDGQPVTAGDVIASLRRWMLRDTLGRRLAKYVVDIEAPAADHVRLRLKEPYPLTLFSLGSAVGQPPFIMREADAKTPPTQMITTSVGSGPFRFNRDAWEPGAKAVFERNTAYRPRSEPTNGLSGARMVNVDRMEWIVMPDAQTAANALARGEVDFIDTVGLDLIPSLKANAAITVEDTSHLDNQALVRPNHLIAPFNNMKARLALAAAVNQQDLMTALVGDPDRFKICYAYFLCGSPYGTTAGSEQLHGPDPERARSLLKESGYAGEPVILLASPDVPASNTLAQVLMPQLKNVGFNMQLELRDWNSIIAKFIKKDPVSAGGWNLLVSYFLGQQLVHPVANIWADTTCGGTNANGWPCDEEATKLLDQYVASASDGDREKSLEMLHRRLWMVQPYAILGQYPNIHAWRRAIKGVVNTPVLAYWNISKE